MKARHMLLVAALCLALLAALPASSAGATSTASGSQPPQAGATMTQAQAARGFWYTVVRGDTLARLARRFGTTINAIWRANPRIWNPNLIYTGQRLWIPVARPGPNPSPKPNPGPSPSPNPNPSPSPPTTTVKVALIALNTGGTVGCGDSVVLVDRQVPATNAPLTAAINELLSIKQRDYGQSGLTNILYNANLQLQKATISDNHADILLTGNLSLGGVCDDPRAIAQFEETAKQFPTVQTVSVFVNGVLLQDLLSGKGS